MDIRTFGKGYEQFYQNAKAMGVEFVRGKVASIREDEVHNPVLKVELTGEGRIVERTYDLVVLSLGMVPAASPQTTSTSLSASFGLLPSSDGFIPIPAMHAAPRTLCHRYRRWTDGHRGQHRHGQFRCLGSLRLHPGENGNRHHTARGGLCLTRK